MVRPAFSAEFKKRMKNLLSSGYSCILMLIFSLFLPAPTPSAISASPPVSRSPRNRLAHLNLTLSTTSLIRIILYLPITIDLNMKPRKNYFTQSQAVLPNLHPPAEFQHLIQAKKEFHSLIKQELRALEEMENEEIEREREKGKEVQVVAFVVEDRLEKEREGEREEKSSGEVARSY